MIDKSKILVDDTPLVVPFLYSGIEPSESYRTDTHWLKNSDQNKFDWMYYPEGIFPINDNDRVLYTHCAIGPGISALLKVAPDIRLTLNDLYSAVIDKALDYLRNIPFTLEARAACPIEDLPPEFNGYDVIFTHSPIPVTQQTLLLHLNRTNETGRIIGTTTGGPDFEPLWLLKGGKEIYGAKYESIVTGTIHEMRYSGEFYIGILHNSPEIKAMAEQDLRVLQVITPLVFPGGPQSTDFQVYLKKQNKSYRFLEEREIISLEKQSVIAELSQEGISLEQAQDSLYRLNRVSHLPIGLFSQGEGEGIKVRFV